MLFDPTYIHNICCLQTGYIKNVDFLRLWNDRADAEHYINNDWPTRLIDGPRRLSCLYITFVEPEYIFLPPLHLKLGLAKHFIEGVCHTGLGIQYLCKKLAGVVPEETQKWGFELSSDSHVG